MAAPGAPLFHLVDVSSLRLVGTVSEQDASLVKLDAPVTIGGKAIPGAKVKSVLPTLDAATRRVPVEAIVPNDGASPMLAGSFVRASISSGTKLDVLVVPATTLRPGTQDEVVVLVQGKAVVKKISFTRGADGELLVRGGLGERDDVVDAPSPDLQDGTRIEAKGRDSQ
jgi:multidrug efflux pump subunit AcrA (membrane-fusion protein)